MNNMTEISFEWNEGKNTINKRKHGVSFEEAKTVFYDLNARVIQDPEQSPENSCSLSLLQTE